MTERTVQTAVALVRDCHALDVDGVRARCASLPEQQRARALRYFGESAAWREWRECRQQAAQAEAHSRSHVADQFAAGLSAEARHEIQKQARAEFRDTVMQKEHGKRLELAAVAELARVLAGEEEKAPR